MKEIVRTIIVGIIVGVLVGSILGFVRYSGSILKQDFINLTAIQGMRMDRQFKEINSSLNAVNERAALNSKHIEEMQKKEVDQRGELDEIKRKLEELEAGGEPVYIIETTTLGRAVVSIPYGDTGLLQYWGKQNTTKLVCFGNATCEIRPGLFMKRTNMEVDCNTGEPILAECKKS